VDLAHIKQVCERHIVKGEKLLKDDGSANFFWVKNKNGELCEVIVRLFSDGWFVYVYKFSASRRSDAGRMSFFSK
jgi:hypothetical protein